MMTTPDNFTLDICTWPQMRGFPHDTETTVWKTAEEARKHVEERAEPFAYAYLQYYIAERPTPCDFDGNSVVNKDWRKYQIRGTNGEHPAYLAYLKDKSSIVKMIREEYEKSVGKRSMNDIAYELMMKRHPLSQGSYYQELAWEAAGED